MMNNNPKLKMKSETHLPLSSVDHSVYNDALRQLHQSNLILQETTQNLLKEQTRLADTLRRVQLDLENYKESNNQRLDEMMTHVDCDIKKLDRDQVKFEEKINLKHEEVSRKCEEVTSKCEQLKEFTQLKGDHESLKQKVDTLGRLKIESNNKSCEEKVESVTRELKSLKVELQNKVSTIESKRLINTIEDSCIKKLEEYIGTEILEAISTTVNLKIDQFKTEVFGDLEPTKIQIDDLSTLVSSMTRRLTDLENPKRAFDESALHALSIDELEASKAQKLDNTAMGIKIKGCATETVVEVMEFSENKKTDYGCNSELFGEFLVLCGTPHFRRKIAQIFLCLMTFLVGWCFFGCFLFNQN